MESEIFLDTHVLVWLYEGNIEKFSPIARKYLEKSKLLACPMSLLELDYLFEIKKITESHQKIVRELENQFDLQIPNDPFADIVKAASLLTWTRDPFDRLIVAHANLYHAPLLTKDRHIGKNAQCVW